MLLHRTKVNTYDGSRVTGQLDFRRFHLSGFGVNQDRLACSKDFLELQELRGQD